MYAEIEGYDMIEVSIEHLNQFYYWEQIPDELYVSGIHRAVLEGDFCKVKRWVESEQCVNERESYHGFSALHLAVIKNDVEILDYLLSRDDIQVDCTCSEGKTPLYLATAFGYIKMVEKLIQAGSDINIADDNNYLPLHMSVKHPDICHLLIRHGAPVNAVHDAGRTSLNFAVEDDGYLETVQMLLYYNVDVNVVDGCFTPFATALLDGKVNIQEVLLEYVDDFNRFISSTLPFGHILSFAFYSNSPFIKDIIERGADVNYGDDLRVTEEYSAFAACLRFPFDLSTFKFIWEKLRYNDSKNTIDFLALLDHVDKVPTFLQVIIENDNFETAVECFSKGDTYFLFVNKFAEEKFDLDQLTALTCRLLEYGFRASSYDIHAIFSNYGDCELFRILLYMDNDFVRGWLPQMVLSRLMFDVNYDLESVVDKVNGIPKETVLQLLEYFVYPRLIDALTLQYNDDESTTTILRSLPRVPLLMELARNAARKQIWHAFKVTNNCQFYTTIDHLTIPAVYKDILTFKRKIYRIK